MLILVDLDHTHVCYLILLSTLIDALLIYRIPIYHILLLITIPLLRESIIFGLRIIQ